MPQIVYTRDQLVQAVLEELKVAPHGQIPNAEEWDAVDDKIDQLIAELAARQVIYIANPDEIPIECFSQLSQALARMLGNVFSLTTDETDKMFYPENSPFSAESKLRHIRRATAARVPQLPDYM